MSDQEGIDSFGNGMRYHEHFGVWHGTMKLSYIVAMKYVLHTRHTSSLHTKNQLLNRLANCFNIAIVLSSLSRCCCNLSSLSAILALSSSSFLISRSFFFRSIAAFLCLKPSVPPEPMSVSSLTSGSGDLSRKDFILALSSAFFSSLRS